MGLLNICSRQQGDKDATHVEDHGTEEEWIDGHAEARWEIHGEWVTLLADECRKAQHAARQVSLDLAEVTYIDDHGLRVMQSLSPEQVRVINCPAFVAELLGQRG